MRYFATDAVKNISRKSIKIQVVTVIFALYFAPNAAVADMAEDSMTHALAMCRAIEGMGLASAPCDVSRRTVTATINMSLLEAAKFCGGAREEMQKVGARFEPGWSLKVVSPFTGESVAHCDL